MTQQDTIEKLVNKWNAQPLFVGSDLFPIEEALNEAYQAGAQAMVERVEKMLLMIPEMSSEWTEEFKKSIPEKNLELQTASNHGWNCVRECIIAIIDDLKSSLTNPDMSEK